MILLRAGSELPRDYATAKLLKGFAYSHRTMVTLGNRGFPSLYHVCWVIPCFYSPFLLLFVCFCGSLPLHWFPIHNAPTAPQVILFPPSLV